MKRKLDETDASGENSKQLRLDESAASTEITTETRATIENIIGSAVLTDGSQIENMETDTTSDDLPAQLKPQPLSYKQTKILEQKAIEHGSEIDSDSMPQTK